MKCTCNAAVLAKLMDMLAWVEGDEMFAVLGGDSVDAVATHLRAEIETIRAEMAPVRYRENQ